MAAKRIARDPFMGDDHRAKIKNSSILNRLIKHAEGGCNMSQSEVTAAISLLRKYLPDLAAVDHTTQGEAIQGGRWWTEAEALQLSHTIQESNSETSTTDRNDGLALWPTDGQVKQ